VALNAVGKVSYSVTFLVIVPAALVAWAMSTSPTVGLPAVHSSRFGIALAVAGALLMLLGMSDLWVYGGGVPMNAHPPPRYVRRGAYRVLPHPIYTGFCVLCAGVSVGVGLPSGLWLVTPLVALCCTALVLGYEHQDLRRRFGFVEGGVLPASDAETPTLNERLRCWLLVVLPWAICCVASGFAMTRSRPLLYAYCVVVTVFLMTPWFARARSALRAMAVRGLVAMLLAFTLYLLSPLILPDNAFVTGVWTGLSASPGVICVLLGAAVLAERWRSLRWIFFVLAALFAGGVALTQSNGIIAACGGMVAFVVAWRIEGVWQAMRESSERLANSWKEWRLGAVRLINHGFYAGMGGFLALWLAGVLAGPGHLAAIVVAGCSAVVGAALWAQWVEGSPQLSRPYGFYGGLLGGTLGAMAAPVFHTSGWLILAVYATGGPWAQGLGRLRCLVQGCCHGGLASEGVGIRYVHPRSRVCRFTSWTNLPLHPTPLYSFLWNAVVGLLLIRLWGLHTALSLITGLYFILSGIGRFAEEGWRGEPQTRIVGGLKIYQWAAIGSVVLGGLITVGGSRVPAPAPMFSWIAVMPAAVFGAFVSCAMGMDFPESKRRFSRLA
jgi:protein-S-isoprenylcysteine O-methyltransferase Ste14